ncbi:uncharacterized protein LOC142665691 isoform X2 [Rhinoderma darwinii]|uniref:uncharacterized protein LOC142665691 isoform X2 n=1 Tax=Rhinoderma darwinii TaxID=43563 RepID=UPI003F6749E7
MNLLIYRLKSNLSGLRGVSGSSLFQRICISCGVQGRRQLPANAGLLLKKTIIDSRFYTSQLQIPKKWFSGRSPRSRSTYRRELGTTQPSAVIYIFRDGVFILCCLRKRSILESRENGIIC